MNHNVDIKLMELIGEAITNQLQCVVLSKEATQERVRKTIRVFMRGHPEIFWFSNQYRFDLLSSTLYLKYNFNIQKKNFYSEQIDNSVHFLFQPERLTSLTDLEKVAYVYKWIESYTTYNEYSSFNQTIFSVLINRNSVCTGYAKTAQYLLGLIGIESELIFGKFHADRSERGRHGWNIVKIDGNWYHVDFCLADPTLKHLLNADEAPIEQDGLLWNYFCKSTEYVLKNRIIEFVEVYPLCSESIDLRFSTKLIMPQKRLSVCKSESGTTSKAFLDSFNKDCVIKVVQDKPNLIDNEVSMLQQLNGCKHIIKCKGHTDDGIVLEQLTPWSELLNSHYYNPDESRLKDILVQLTEGLAECADNGITYSDIHYNNVFVTKDGVYKWGDFGIAFPSTPDGSLPSQMFGEDGVAFGSRWFMAPETYHKGIFTESSAVYSLAMLAYFVMNDMRPPFWNQNESESQILNKRLSGATVEPSINHSRFGDLSCKVCDILNANVDNRIQTFDEFISLLRQESIIDLAENESSIQKDQLATDEDALKTKREVLKKKLMGSGKIALKFDGNVAGTSTTFDTTISIPKGKLIDSDCFATSIIPSCNYDKWGDDLTHDIDSCARTCGVGAKSESFEQVYVDIPKNPPSTTSHNYSERETTTTYSPVQRPAKDQGKSTRPQPQDCAPESLSGVGAVSFGIATIAANVIGNAIRGLFTGFALGCNNHSKRSDIHDSISYNQTEINSCVYAPAEIRPRKSFIIRVYMYKPEEQNDVASKVKEIDPSAIKKEYKPLDIPVNIGDKLTVQLSLSEGVVCERVVKSVMWKGRFTDCSFSAKLTDEQQESVDGTVYIFINDVPAGEMLFTIDVVKSEPKERYAKIDAHRFSKIFISYAHQDEDKVRGIAEGCRMLGKDYFFDRHTLHPGDIFKDKIFNYIDNADLFVLCWSKNAAESEWVKIEREHALRLIREGKTTLSIYPLCLPPEAPLPLDMSDKYNFGVL